MRSRKFWSAWVLTILTSILLLEGALESQTWGSTISIIWAAYFAANHFDKRVNGE